MIRVEMPGVQGAVAVCSNTYYKTKNRPDGVSYFRFPKKEILRKVWIERCNRKDSLNADTSFICSDHFKEEDFVRNLRAELMGSKQIKFIQPDAVPSVKLSSIGGNSKGKGRERNEIVGLKPNKTEHDDPRPSSSTDVNPPLEPLASVLIKEELDVDDDYSANTSETSRHGDDMDYEGSFDDTEPTDPLEECKYVSRDINFGEGSSKEVIPESNYLAKEDNVPTSEKTDSASAVNDGLSTILRIADSLALDINNILTDDLGLNDVSPTQPRSETLKSSEKDATLGELKSKCTELEQKLRIHYLKVMLKKEEELVNIKIEASKVYLQNAKIEAEQKREAHLQKMENLKLEHKLMQLRLEKEAKQNV